MDPRARTAGQSLSEYALAGLLVAMVALGALGMLGSALAGELPALLDRVFGDSAGSGNVPGGMSGGHHSQSTGTMTPVNVPSGTTGSTYGQLLTLSDGTVVTLNNRPQSLWDSVETSGGNGTTSRILADFDTLITALDNDPAVSDADVRTLKALSNQGHRMAAIQKALEDGLKNMPPGSTFRTATTTFEGKSYTLYEISGRLGLYVDPSGKPPAGANPLKYYNAYTSNNGGGSDIYGNSLYMGREMSQFITLYNQALASPTMGNPQVESFVTRMSEEIAAISASSESVIENQSYIGSGGGNVFGTYTNAMNQRLKQGMNGYIGVNVADSANFADATHTKSDNICTAGGGTGTGTGCN